MLALLPVAFALTPDSVRAAMDGLGWQDVGERQTEVGLVAVRHLPLDGIDCLEASASTTLDLERMKTIVVDIRGNPEWSSAALTQSQVLAEAEGTVDYLQVLDNPSPISDRYWYLRGTWGPTGEGWALSWEHFDGEAEYPKAHAELRASHQGAVPVTFNVGSWAFLPQGSATVARFRSCSDAGGNVPRWAGEAAARRMLPNNIIDLFKAAGDASSGR